MAAILRRLTGELRRSASILSPPRFLSVSPLYHQLPPSPFSFNRRIGDLGPSQSPFSPFQMIVRCKTKQTRARAPDTPFKSKLNKYKIKGYSSYKRRFKPLNDGTIRRWKEGTRHNAHSKNEGKFEFTTNVDPPTSEPHSTSLYESKKAKRRLRSPGLVSLAYAKVMKKLNFFG